MMEPWMNSNTTTNAKRSQTLILAEDEYDKTLVFSQLSAEVWVSLSNGYKESASMDSNFRYRISRKTKPYDEGALQ